MLRISTVISVASWLFDTLKDLSTSVEGGQGMTRQAAPPPPIDNAEMQANGMLIRRWHAQAFAYHHRKTRLSATTQKILSEQAGRLEATICETAEERRRQKQFVRYAMKVPMEEDKPIIEAFEAVYRSAPRLNKAWMQAIVDDCQDLARVHAPKKACHVLLRQLAGNLGVNVRRRPRR